MNRDQQANERKDEPGLSKLEKGTLPLRDLAKGSSDRTTKAMATTKPIGHPTQKDPHELLNKLAFAAAQ